MVVVGEADPLPVRTEDMDMRAAAQGAGSKGRSEVARVQVYGDAGVRKIHQDTLPAGRTIIPVFRGIFGAVNKDNLLLGGVIRDAAAVGAASGLVQDLYLPRLDIDPLDARAVESGAVGIGAGVVDDPAAVRRPDGAVGQYAPAGT